MLENIKFLVVSLNIKQKKGRVVISVLAFRESSDVLVCVSLILNPFQIILFDQSLDLFFDQNNGGFETTLQLFEHFG